MAIPAVAEQFYREQRRLAGKVLIPAARMWGDAAPADFDAWFAEHVDELVALLVAGQSEAVSQALDYVPAVLAAQGAAVAPEVDPDPAGLLGVAGDGRPLDSLLYGAVITTRAAIAKSPAPEPGASLNGAFANLAWAEQGLSALMLRMQTVIADTSRVATGLATISRPRTGFVRMLVGSSCPRCVVLAGRTYGSGSAFLRHPGCDCRHVPDRTDRLDLKTLDSDTHFRSLTRAEQDRQFTKAGAQAIRDGADIAQVVNARRGSGLDFASGRITEAEAEAIRRGRTIGRAGPVTTEGTTRRGWAYRAMRSGPGPKPPQRLMPEAIYQAARGDRARALELLQLHGYVMPSPSSLPPTGALGGGAGSGGGFLTFAKGVAASDRTTITGDLARVPAHVKDRLERQGLRVLVANVMSEQTDVAIRTKWAGKETADGRKLEETSFFSPSDDAILLNLKGGSGSVAVAVHELGHAVDMMYLRGNPATVEVQNQGASNLLGPVQKIVQKPLTTTIRNIRDDPYIGWAHERVRGTSAPKYFRLGSEGTPDSGRSEWVAEGYAAAVKADRDVLVRISGGDEQAADMLVWSFRRLGVL